jgi:RND family efflux transporter MFP subunit
MRILKAPTQSLALITILVLAACAPQSAGVPKPKNLVQVAVAQPATHTTRQVLTGAVQARAETPAAFLVSGRITTTELAVGERVSKGQLLATLVDTEQQADLEAAQAGVAAANSRVTQVSTTLERQTSLWKQGLTTRSAFDSAETAAEIAANAAASAQAQLNLAEEALSYTKLTASADGIIIRKLADNDEVIQAGSPVYVIAEDGPRNVLINVQETAMAGLALGHKVSVSLINPPRTEFVGAIAEIAPALDATGTVQVKIAINADLGLGSSVAVTLENSTGDRIALPAQALSQSHGEAKVWVVDSGQTARLVPVVVEAYENGTVVLEDGLAAGDRVVIAGAQFLTEGETVDVEELEAK